MAARENPKKAGKPGGMSTTATSEALKIVPKILYFESPLEVSLVHPDHSQDCTPKPSFDLKGLRNPGLNSQPAHHGFTGGLFGIFEGGGHAIDRRRNLYRSRHSSI